MTPNDFKAPAPRVLTPPRPPTNIPFVAPKAPTSAFRDPNPLPRDEAYGGRFKHNEDGEDYALAIVEEDSLGRTHKLKNSLHFYECDEKQFKTTFTPVLAR